MAQTAALTYTKVIAGAKTAWTGLEVKLYSDEETPVYKYTLTDASNIGYYSNAGVEPGVYRVYDDTGGSLADSGRKVIAPSFGYRTGYLPGIGTEIGDGQIVETDDDHKLKTAAKGTAFNKDFGFAVGSVPEIGTALGASQIVETDANKKLKTASKGTAYNKNFGTGETDIPTVAHAHGEVKVNGTEGGQWLLKSAYAASTAIIGERYCLIEVNIPGNVLIESVQIRVDVAFAQQWNARFRGGADDVFTTGNDYTINTKVNSIMTDRLITTDLTDIQIFPTSEGQTFLTEGRATAIVYYWTFTAMDNAGA